MGPMSTGSRERTPPQAVQCTQIQIGVERVILQDNNLEKKKLHVNNPSITQAQCLCYVTQLCDTTGENRSQPVLGTPLVSQAVKLTSCSICRHHERTKKRTYSDSWVYYVPSQASHITASTEPHNETLFESA